MRKISTTLMVLMFVIGAYAQQLQLSFLNLDNLRGKTFYLKVVDAQTEKIVTLRAEVIAGQVDFSISQLAMNATYQLDFWVDQNMNGTYEAPPVDYAWRDRVTISADAGKYAWRFTDQFTDIQWKDILALRLNGFENYTGLNLYARMYNQRKFSTQEVLSLEGSPKTPVLFAENLNRNDPYRIEFFFDVNKNGKYDAPPIDVAWAIDPIEKDLDGDGQPDMVCYGVDDDCDGLVDYNYNENYTDIGWNNHLRIDFVGADPSLGGDMYVTLIDTTKAHSKEVDYFVTLKNFDGISTFVPVSPVAKTSQYKAKWFIDFNGNGESDNDEPGGEENVKTNQYGVIPLTLKYNIAAQSVQDPYRIEIRTNNKSFTGDKVINILKSKLPKYNGQIDYYGSTLAGYSYTALYINDVQPGDYTLMYYEDTDGDGKFSPAVEQVWSKQINVKDKLTVVELDNSTPANDWPEVLTVRIDHFNVRQDFGQVQIHAAAYKKGSNPLFIDPLAKGDNPLYENCEVYLTGLPSDEAHDVYVWIDDNGNGLYDAPPVDRSFVFAASDDYGSGGALVCHGGIDDDCDDILDWKESDQTVIKWRDKACINYSGLNASYIGHKIYTKIIDKADPLLVTDFTIDDISGETLATARKNLSVSAGSFVEFFIDLDDDGWFNNETDIAYQIPIHDLNQDGMVDVLVSGLKPLVNPVITGIVEVHITGSNERDGVKRVMKRIDQTTPILMTNYVDIDDAPGDFSLFLSGSKPMHSYTVATKFESADPTSQSDEVYTANIDIGDFYQKLELSPANINDTARWGSTVKIHFDGFDNYSGQTLRMKAKEKANKTKCSNSLRVTNGKFETTLTGIEAGKEYEVLLWIDTDYDDVYNPETDPSWQYEFTAKEGPNELMASANDGFKSFFWNYELYLGLHNMDPHAGQAIRFFLRKQPSNAQKDFAIFGVPGPNFSFFSEELEFNNEYNIDFFTDVNNNGLYDAPPVDHSWRIPVGPVSGDVEVHFFHAGNFTNIEDQTSIDSYTESELKVYPNPAFDYLEITNRNKKFQTIEIISLNGDKVLKYEVDGQTTIDISALPPGSYFVILNAIDKIEAHKFIKF